jgi:hypothetical protein
MAALKPFVASSPISCEGFYFPLPSKYGIMTT